MLHVVRADGTTFRAPPSKVGVEGELYTRLDPSGAKDRDIERWFSREIETPFAGALAQLLTLEGIERRKFPGHGDPVKRKEVQELGFIVGDYDERMPLTVPVRHAIANYLAALVVRSPSYLTKLTDWHWANNGTSGLPVDPAIFRGFALENMLFLYDVYREAIAGGYINLMIADCGREFLFADGGVTAREPWSKRPMPFDLYAPLTPKLAFNVLPLPDAYTGGLWISRINARGVARFNRMMLADAKSFVFSKSPTPLDFIAKHLGVPAPSPFGSRWIDGRLETKYDRSRDRPL
ncbi:DUF4238 domain-containing protein [Sphingomonas naphthae]|uniref:DUF4238 domain-containing protein n=1 Tax=Sphingomonas naphthae TaxID=1813468 RepID=A0ABY7TIN1_9SPHN|nr:DUF4238 domain-containing protein [Sphingomonas naphthae]WCT73040.1 DUF4238 domain-containing protein [Sphingomonas naphthae]